MAKAKEALTVGDIAKQVSKIKATQLLYVLLLVAAFLLGNLSARVSLLEKNSKPAAPNIPTQQAAQAPQQPNPNVKVNVAVGKLPLRGNANAKVTLVDFSDFQCPFCERFFSDAFAQIKKDYIDTGKVKMAFRNFPLDFHPAAMPAALAAECANEQGKFWEYHDKVFSEQSKISTQGQSADSIKSQLKTWAGDLGLNQAQFDGCLDSEKYKADVTQDINDGKTAGVSGTPTLYVNGRQIVGAQPYTAFKTVIDEELKK